ncbi:hypothetical protein GCM10019017_43930 [Streptomyces showdoensis]
MPVRRAAATTTSPAPTAASAKARPKPLFAPVTNQTLLMVFRSPRRPNSVNKTAGKGRCPSKILRDSQGA